MRALSGWFLVVLALGIVRGARSADLPTLTLDAGGHTASVTSLAVTPEGQLLSGSFDGTIRLWDLTTGETLRVIRGQLGAGRRGQLNRLALTPDGGTLLVGGWFDDTEEAHHPIRVYSWPAGTIRGLLQGHERPVRALALSPDGQLLATGDAGGVLRLWRRSGETFEQQAAVQAHNGKFAELAFDPTGQDLLVSCAQDGTARFWSVTGGKLAVLKTIQPLSVPQIRDLAFRPDGQVLAFAGSEEQFKSDRPNGEVRFYNPAGELLGDPITFPKTGASAIAFSPDSRRLVVGLGDPGTDNRVIIYSHPDGKPLAEFHGHDNSVGVIRFLPEGRTVVSTGGFDNAIRRWDSTTGEALPLLGGRSRVLWNAAIGQDGRTLYWGAGLYDTTAHFTLEKYNDRGPLDWGLSLADSVDLVPAAGADVQRGTIESFSQRLKLRQGEKLQFLELAGGGPPMSSGYERDIIFGATFLPGTDPARLDAKLPVLVAGSQSLGLFDAATGRRIRELIGHHGEVLATAPSPKGDFALSAGADQTARLWHLPTGELRLSIFQAGTDWVAWTPQGYYAASPQGDQLIGWQVNHGEGHDPENFSAAQFKNVLYRPDIIPQVLSTAGPPDIGLGLADLGQIKPPTVEIISPKEPAVGPLELTGPTLDIKAQAESGGAQPVTVLRLLLNGRPFQGKAGLFKVADPQPGVVQASWSVDLTPGTHEVAVQAESAVSKALSAAVHVTYKPSDETDVAELPNLYVLSVGVAAYPEGLRLNYAAKDAQALVDTLRTASQPLFHKIEVQLLTDQQATQREILNGLNWLRKETTHRDVAIVFFSGHGFQDNDGSLYLLPVDVDVDNLLATGLSEQTFKTALQGIAGRVIALLDACHAGSIGADKRKGLTDDLLRDLVTDDYGVVVMASSIPRESSIESNTEKQGVFTLALVEGLTGKADVNRDHVVYLNELDLYVAERVKELTKGHQHPATAKPSSIRSFPLARTGATQESGTATP